MTGFPSLDSPAWPARLARGGLSVIGLALAICVLAGPLHRFDIVGFRPAMLTLAAGFVLLTVGALLAIVGLLAASSRRVAIPRGAAVLGISIALLVIAYLLSWLAQWRSTPPIHEISTDLEDPPQFVAVRDLRARVPDVNPAEYVARVEGPRGTIDVPALQHRHYPGIRTLELQVSPGLALERARRAAERLGWEIVAVAPDEGRLEATDITPFFGLEDDVVVRVRPTEGGGARVDVRSKSRVGLRDAGRNAERIRRFLELMQGR